MSLPVTKTYGTLLRSHPDVNAQFEKVAAVQAEAGIGPAGPGTGGEGSAWQSPIELPLEFDGRVVWKHYLSEIRSQGNCGDCFAIATADSLGDRFSLFTFGQVPASLSACSLTICEYDDIKDISDYQAAFLNEQAAAGHAQTALQNSACYGNTLINAARFCVYQGIPFRYCCGTGPALLNNALLNFADPKKLPICEQLQGLHHTHCSDGKTAMHVFRARTFGVVDSGEEYLKYTLYKFGPFAAGFDVFEDFLTGYDGKTIYVPAPNQKASGGHAVRVVGWGGGPGTSEEIPYWIIANSWGTDWGDQGYFKMQRNSLCNLEKNVVVTLPALNNYDTPTSATATILLSAKELAIRDSYVLDKTTKYPVKALPKIKTGELQGDLRPIIDYNYVLENVKNPLDQTFYAGRDVPSQPPNIPRLPAVPIDDLLRANGLSTTVGNQLQWGLLWGALLLMTILLLGVIFFLGGTSQRGQRRG